MLLVSLSAWRYPRAVTILLSSSNDRYATVELWRKALVKQLLTPAPDTASVKWKQTVLAGRSLRHTDVKPERLKHIIDEDLAFLAAHPVRQSNRSARAKDDGGAA